MMMHIERFRTSRDGERTRNDWDVRVSDLDAELHNDGQQDDRRNRVRDERREAQHERAQRDGHHPDTSRWKRVNHRIAQRVQQARALDRLPIERAKRRSDDVMKETRRSIVRSDTYFAENVTTTDEEEDVPRKGVEVKLTQHPRAEHDELSVPSIKSRGQQSQAFNVKWTQ